MLANITSRDQSKLGACKKVCSSDEFIKIQNRVGVLGSTERSATLSLTAPSDSCIPPESAASSGLGTSKNENKWVGKAKPQQIQVCRDFAILFNCGWPRLSITHGFVEFKSSQDKCPIIPPNRRAHQTAAMDHADKDVHRERVRSCTCESPKLKPVCHCSRSRRRVLERC